MAWLRLQGWDCVVKRAWLESRDWDCVIRIALLGSRGSGCTVEIDGNPIASRLWAVAHPVGTIFTESNTQRQQVTEAETTCLLSSPSSGPKASSGQQQSSRASTPPPPCGAALRDSRNARRSNAFLPRVAQCGGRASGGGASERPGRSPVHMSLPHPSLFRGGLGVGWVEGVDKNEHLFFRELQRRLSCRRDSRPSPPPAIGIWNFLPPAQGRKREMTSDRAPPSVWKSGSES